MLSGAMSDEPAAARPIDHRLVLGALVFIGYSAVARSVGNLYPFSIFPMYAGKAGDATSRVMVRGADGAYEEVPRYEGFACESLPVLETTTCAGVAGIPYIDREREQHIREHAGTGGQPVELVRRVFSFDGKSRPSHCVSTRCTAVKR